MLNQAHIGTPILSAQMTPIVSFYGLQKINRLLYPMAHTLSPIFDCSPREFLTKFGAVLTAIGALVYQADAEIEAAQRGEAQFVGIEPWLRGRGQISALLKELAIDDPEAERLLDNVGRYWEVENELNYRGHVTAERLAQAIELRSCDLLAYHHLCLHIAGVQNIAEIFQVMMPWQIYLEFAFDLLEYPDDVAARDYNTYRMFVSLYGREAPRYLQAEIGRYAALMESRLALLGAADQRRLRTAFDNALSDIGGFPAIPEPILEQRPIGAE